ncbi:MAG: hypothetical protein OYG31_02935 [Candidatus Kaiserbacteria bacterium]|nr:hypothetical protein [Candidatus Kaiserbacteria bacterium]
MTRFFSLVLITIVGVNIASAENVLDKMLAHKAAQIEAEANKQSDKIYIDGEVSTSFQVVAGNCLDVTLRGQSGGMDENVFTKCMEEHFRGRDTGLTTDELVAVIEALGDYVLKVTLNTNSDYNSALPFFHDMVKSVTETVLASAKQAKSQHVATAPAPHVDADPIVVDDNGGSPLPAVVDGDDSGVTTQPADPTAGSDSEWIGLIAIGVWVLSALLVIAIMFFAYRFLFQKGRN